MSMGLNHEIPQETNGFPEIQGENILTAIIQDITACKPNHSYLTAMGLTGAPGKAYMGNSEIGGVQCHGSVALVIRNIESVAVNVLMMVQTPDAMFEDVLIPGAKLAGCYGCIGKLGDTILVVEDYASGMSLHHATGHGVAVTLYSGNLLSVCAGLKKKYPNKIIIVCGGKYEESSERSNLVIATVAARKAGALVAFPESAFTFHDQYRQHGLNDIRRVISAATEPSNMFEPEPTDNESGISPEPNLWPNPVNGAALMADMLKVFRRYVILQRDEVLALSLWTLFTHVLDVVRVAPILALVSPVKRCGKTTVLVILEHLVYQPLPSSNLTPAVLFRLVEASRPTLIIDEADTFLGKSDELIGIINSGHTRDTAYVQRMGQGNRPRRYRTFCPKVIAGIGKRSATIMDRSVVIKHQRKRPDEFVEKYRPAPNDEIAALRARIARWSLDNRDAISCAEFESPNLGNDRACDNWEPLLAIAHCLGEVWFDRATLAAIALTISQDNAKCTGEELLRDIKAVFESVKVDKLPTNLLIGGLCADAEKPWGSFNRGKPLTPRDLSNLLSDFEITSKNLRIGTTVIKGYELGQFEDAFARYVPPEPL